MLRFGSPTDTETAGLPASAMAAEEASASSNAGFFRVSDVLSPYAKLRAGASRALNVEPLLFRLHPKEGGDPKRRRRLQTQIKATQINVMTTNHGCGPFRRAFSRLFRPKPTTFWLTIMRRSVLTHAPFRRHDKIRFRSFYPCEIASHTICSGAEDGCFTTISSGCRRQSTFKVNDMSTGIPSDLEPFVQRMIAAKRFLSEEDVLAEGLRMLQARETLRDEVVKGFVQLDAGDRIPVEQVYSRAEQRIAQIERGDT